MAMNLADVMIHVDESLDSAKFSQIEADLRSLEGVVAVARHDETPHLMILEYDPDKVGSHDLLERVTADGVHAELVGL